MPLDEIIAKLPNVLAWIDDLLTRTRPQAIQVSTLPFERLRLYYSAGSLEQAWCVVTDEVPVPPLTELGIPGFEEFERMSAHGITFKDTYFVRRDQAKDEGLHVHELVHTIQWRQLGAEGFLKAYAAGYLAAGGYEQNPFEQIAYDLQSGFQRGEWEFQAEPLTVNHLRKTMAELSAV